MASSEPVRCLHMGLGPIGCGILQLVRERPGFQVVGAVDPSPDKAGRDIAEVAGLPEAVGLQVAESIRECPSADLVFHSTGSHLPQIVGQLREVLELGLDCVSTAEELTWPWLRRPDLAEELDALARARGARLLGTGINPGFVLDLLPMVLTTPCRELHRIVARRIVDTAARRPQLQQKTGLGLTVREYRERADRGAIGHVGLRESAALLAAGLGWTPQEITETIDPVLAGEPLETHHFSVSAGGVCGSRQTAVAVVAGEDRLRLELEIYAGARDPRDQIEIVGRPSFTVRIDGGLPGDVATPACVANAAALLQTIPPGLVTMKDIPTPRWKD